ncbi:alpha/beta hydrolase [Escherichia coli]|uniref:alpha/beta hydrolase n=1 Tax=Escherichia coli TaxID=562 RepID=UPI00124C0618|nr:alpha/beta hydrolase [Escherichia coli]KAB2827039.1 alpha/beta hydrolase [Escherichia coli]HDD9400094.1 alpha/beta hydrolase [Escherichia coli]
MTLFLFLFSFFISGTVSAQRIEWQSCMTSPYSDWFGVESPSPELLCGYLSVPLKYTDTGGDISGENIPFVRLAMTKLPAKSKHKGSLLIISGGPGLPGINPYINFDWPVTNLRESWDIIGFDPRGVGKSIPAINCQQPDGKRSENITDKQRILQRINACIHNTGAEVIRHIGSNEAVYDIERIRQALGDKQLTAVAYSYGTQIAALYAERFPSSIRSVVLDGVVDIDDLNDNFTWQLRQAHSYQETFDRFATWCARTKSCPLSSDRIQAIHQFHELLLKLHHSPLTDSRGESISSDELISLTTELLLWRSSWPTLATAVRQFSQGIVSNEIETALNSSIVSEEISDALGVILCVDQGDEQLTLEVRKSRKKALADAFPAVNFKRGLSDFPEFCELWPIHRDLNKTRLNNAVLPSGLLFVSHKYDPTTPWINARKMADKFSAPLLTINGDGHTLALTGTNLCVDEAVVRHLLLPRKTEDITCQGSGAGDTN